MCHLNWGVKCLNQIISWCHCIQGCLLDISGFYHSSFDPSKICAVCLLGNLLSLDLKNWLIFYVACFSSGCFIIYRSMYSSCQCGVLIMFFYVPPLTYHSFIKRIYSTFTLTLQCSSGINLPAGWAHSLSCSCIVPECVAQGYATVKKLNGPSGYYETTNPSAVPLSDRVRHQ